MNNSTNLYFHYLSGNELHLFKWIFFVFRYNERYGNDGMHEMLLWEEVEEKVKTFKEKYVYPTIVNKEIEEESMLWWLQEKLARHSYDDENNYESDENGDDDDDENRTDKKGTEDNENENSDVNNIVDQNVNEKSLSSS